MGADPAEFLDGPAQEAVGTVQFKKLDTVSPATAAALGELVMAVFEMVRSRRKKVEQLGGPGDHLPARLQCLVRDDGLQVSDGVGLKVT